MNKKILLISSVLITLSIIMIIIINNMDNKENNIISNIKKDTEVINSNMITMMYETDAGTGIYEETKDTTWPESGYIFNENLSGCENGGELEYNSINKTVNLLSNKSDNCYVYFDKYDGVWIDNVSVTNVTGSSVTLDISATSENGSITTYYYSLNDNEEYQETTTNPLTINDLNKLTEYKISIYAIDSTNARSNIYELTVTTADESGPVINSVSVSNVTYNGFTVTVDATSDVDIVRYHYVIESENIAVSDLYNSHVFSDLDTGTNYKVEIYVKDINGILSEVYQLNISTEDGVLLANYIISQYTTDGENGLYYHDADLANGAGDNSYRYSGANPNNYVCFGSDEEICSEDNLYRIIGVFGNEVKLIKSTSYGSYVWEADIWGQGNTWDASTKPDIYTTLNNTYYNSLGMTWSSMIATHSYEVGGMSYSNGYFNGAQTAYNYEVGEYQAGYVESMKIGLMYLSDYYYGASPTYWTYPGYTSSRYPDANGNYGSSYDYRAAIGSNWIYLGPDEWTISHFAEFMAFYIVTDGIDNGSDSVDNSNEIRPVFYLKQDIKCVSGTGSISEPFRITD